MYPTTIVETLNRIALGQPVEPRELAEARRECGMAPRGYVDVTGREGEPIPPRADPDAGDPSTWPAWTDEPAATWAPEVHTIGPDDILDGPPPRLDGPTTDLAGWVEAEMERYRRMGTEAADLVAATLHDLAAEIHILGARTPEAVYDRRAALLSTDA